MLVRIAENKLVPAEMEWIQSGGQQGLKVRLLGQRCWYLLTGEQAKKVWEQCQRQSLDLRDLLPWCEDYFRERKGAA